MRVKCVLCEEDFDYDTHASIPFEVWGYTDIEDFKKNHLFVCGECS